jgi:hypothetical protein
MFVEYEISIGVTNRILTKYVSGANILLNVIEQDIRLKDFSINLI